VLTPRSEADSECRDVGIAAVIPTSRGVGELQEDARRGVGRAASFDEVDRPMEVDLDVRCNDRRRIEVKAAPTERVEAPGKYLCRLVDAKILELRSSHDCPPLMRAAPPCRPSYAMAAGSAMDGHPHFPRRTRPA